MLKRFNNNNVGITFTLFLFLCSINSCEWHLNDEMRCCRLFPIALSDVGHSCLRCSQIIRSHTFSGLPQYPIINYFKHYYLYFLFLLWRSHTLTTNANTHEHRSLSVTHRSQSSFAYSYFYFYFFFSFFFLSFVYLYSDDSSESMLFFVCSLRITACETTNINL